MTNPPPANPPSYEAPYNPAPAPGQGFTPPPAQPGGPAGQPVYPPQGPDTNAGPAQPAGPGATPGSGEATPGSGESGGHDQHERPVGFDRKGRVKRGRVSAAWVGLIGTAIFLILLIIFIAQNLKKATIHFLGLSGHFPIGLTVLIAAVAGLLLVAIPGTIRIFQLRRALKINTPKEQRLT